MAIITTHIHTPVGDLIAGATDAGICMLDYPYRKSISNIQRRISEGLQDEFSPGDHPHLKTLSLELDEYFSGGRKTFSVPLNPIGSVFQKKIWELLLQIPYGGVSTYMAQAKSYGDEKAIRAIATANGMNGISIIIPCHRVVGTNGSLTGYAGGLGAKRWLLDHERKHAGLEMQAVLF